MVEKQDSDKGGAGEGMKILEILHAVLRRKMLIISVTALTAVFSCCYSLTLPNIYAATARLLPPQKEGGGISAMLGQMGGIAGMAAGAAKGSENELYVSLLKSRRVGAAVVKRLDLAKRYRTSDPENAWRKLDAAVKVQAGRDGILTITAEDPDPKQAALVANTMVEELGRTMVRLNLTKAGAERIFLESRLEVVKKDLKTAEDDLKSFAQRTKVVHVESQADASISTVMRLRSELLNKETQLAVLRTSQSDESFEVKELQAGIKRLRQNLAELSGKSGGEGMPALGDVPGLGLEYSRRFRELKAQEALFEQISKQYEMAKLSEAKDTSSLQVLDEALPPKEKSRPKRSTVVAMATLIAFIASTVLVLCLEYLEKMPAEEREALDALRKQALSLR